MFSGGVELGGIGVQPLQASVRYLYVHAHARICSLLSKVMSV